MFKKSTNAVQKSTKPGWKILIVDDEPDIHVITKLALGKFTFDDRPLKFLSAHSGEEANQILASEEDIALVFLDVVMETDDAGLRVVKYIREELKNKFVRIILRTGQPGQAPERDVIVNYDINDYKEKTNLSSEKLFTVTLASLRSYKDIISVEEARNRLENHKIGLERVLNASSNLFRIRSMKKFADGLLVQLANLLHIDKDTLLIRTNSCTVTKTNDNFEVIAGTGMFASNAEPESDIPDNVRQLLDKAHAAQKSILEGDVYIGYYSAYNGKVNLIYLEGVNDIDSLDQQMLELFSTNITIAFENLHLDREVFETQCEIIDTLGDVVESRSKEAANHVKRVSHLSKALAVWYGLEDDIANELFMAAPMHDVGKVAIPDTVLLKPGSLEANEWDIMKTHVDIGEEIFGRSTRPVLKAASVVAGQHHEKYDGSGYPRGLKGEDIHIYGRIVALVDVFDALSHERCYKPAWPMEKVLGLLKEEAGKHFDPKLVELFLANIDEVIEIMNRYPD